MDAITSPPKQRTALTPTQRDALFTAAAKAITPENADHLPDDPLKPWRRQILRSYKRGYSIRQIVQILAAPDIGVKVSQRAVRRLLTPADKNAQPSKP